MNYKYIPEIGKRVKFKEWLDYTSRNIHPWAWFEVVAYNDECELIELQHSNGGKLGETVTVPLDIIEAPLGWKEKYTICVEPSKAETVKSWLERGITVRTSHDLGNYGVVFQPLDNSEEPNWRYPEVTDKIPAEQVKDRIKIVQLEQEFDAFVMANCEYCAGTGIRTAIKEVSASDVAECWVCHGAGVGKKFISSFDKKERKGVIKSLEKEGWKVGYRKKGDSGYWMERETIIKNWGE
jgi:hypothetical protein